MRLHGYLERFRTPTQKVIGWIVQRVGRGLPAFAIRYAERDESARTQAGTDLLQERRGIGLVFQHFEKGDDIKNFVGMVRAEGLQGQGEHPSAGTVARGEAGRPGIEFDAGSGIAGIGRCEEEVTGAAANVQEAAAARSE